MLLPLEWLKEIVKTDLDKDRISEILTMAGLEVEGEELSGGDVVLEVNITPNRPDCLSVVGVARELRAATNAEIKMPAFEVQGEFTPEFIVKIDSPLCKRYAGRIIRGVEIGPSPQWLKRRLELSGIRSINNVVDVTNYVLLEMGHPLHAFDLDTLKGGMIRVDIPGEPMEFETLDGIKRIIPPDGLLIWDGERPVAVAGIMGGLETEVKDDTVNIFLESAYFVPASIRKTSRRLGLSTESSYRFERGTDIEGLVQALDRASLLIKELAGGEVSERIDVYPEKVEPVRVKLRYREVNRLLGSQIDRSEMDRILNALDFRMIDSGEDYALYEIPTFRVDINMETDLIEEIARHYGYGRIPARTPKVETLPVVDRKAKALSKIKETMILSGFTEAINYSFMNRQYLDMLRIPSEDIRRKTVQLLNPLRQEDAELRTFLLPSLLKNLQDNLNQYIRDIRLFEISKVFIKTDSKLPEEHLHLGAIYLYYPGQRLWDSKEEPFYILKGVLQKILKRLNIKDFDVKNTTEPFLHPGRSADIWLGGERIGFLGVLSADIKNVMDLEDVKEDIGVLEIDLKKVIELYNDTYSYKGIPAFPYVQRDISLLLDKTVEAKRVLDLIRDFGEELIEQYWIFDHYEGKSIPEGMKSLGISIRYRATDRTLTDEEVDRIHERLVGYLMDKTGGRLR